MLKGLYRTSRTAL